MIRKLPWSHIIVVEMSVLQFHPARHVESALSSWRHQFRSQIIPKVDAQALLPEVLLAFSSVLHTMTNISGSVLYTISNCCQGVSNLDDNIESAWILWGGWFYGLYTSACECTALVYILGTNNI